MSINASIIRTAPKRRKGKKAAAVVAVVLILIVIAGLICIPFGVMPMFLGQRYEQKQHDATDFGVEAERITLNTDDQLALAAWRTRADKPKGTVIILSGIDNPSVTAFFGYAKMFADNGWDSLLIEMRARSLSEGEEIGFGMTEWRDVKAGVDYLSADQRAGVLPIVTMGTSMGAGTVIIAAGELRRVDGVITLSAFSSWSDLFIDNMAMFGMPKFLGVMDMPFINLFLGLHFGFDALSYSPENGIAKLGDRPILLMHSTGDTQVPFSQYEKLSRQAQKYGVNITSFIREGDEHFICYEADFKEPTKDTEFSGAILTFLNDNFS